MIRINTTLYHILSSRSIIFSCERLATARSLQKQDARPTQRGQRTAQRTARPRPDWHPKKNTIVSLSPPLGAPRQRAGAHHYYTSALHAHKQEESRTTTDSVWHGFCTPVGFPSTYSKDNQSSLLYPTGEGKNSTLVSAQPLPRAASQLQDHMDRAPCGDVVVWQGVVVR